MTDRRRFPGVFEAISALLMSLAAVTADAAPGAPVAQFQPFKIGTYSAVALKDGGIEAPVDGKSFIVGQPNEAVGAVLKAGGASADHFEFSIQPLLVHAGAHVLLFDTGAGGFFGAIAGKLPESMKAAGENPASVTDIFISHAHGDHIGGLETSTGALAFPNATIHISAPEWKWLSGLSADEAKNFGIQQVSALVSAIKPKVVAFEPGADLLPGIVKAVELKGHTPGHSGYRIGSGTDGVLVFGDAMHSYLVSVRKPSWQVAFDGDKQLGATTRIALIKSSAASGQRLYSEHFPFPGIGKIVKGKDGASWQAESLH
ncbi:MAG TPA: MBL fold metallo-hydrolase [Pinirhizobacter sp.]|uniref:MBL fold metallo-hydrolase n=1 Tax=Pinirhizobacter sp. TaxID=2950432 RepID=UPI002CCADFE0|nr:MBL fold metallo-hydrolase [Pinirhizobacter sp.]HMH66669.1 MBL fold metallo-hydrolase [Pinirhizobacter sp.]